MGIVLAIKVVMDPDTSIRIEMGNVGLRAFERNNLYERTQANSNGP